MAAALCRGGLKLIILALVQYFSIHYIRDLCGDNLAAIFAYGVPRNPSLLQWVGAVPVLYFPHFLCMLYELADVRGEGAFLVFLAHGDFLHLVGDKLVHHLEVLIHVLLCIGFVAAFRIRDVCHRHPDVLLKILRNACGNLTPQSRATL